MRREFLKNLGIEDKNIIDQILDENSADIGRAKGELDTYKSKVTDLETKLASKDSEISTLKTKVGDTDSLNAQITQLTAEKNELTTKLNTEVSKLQKEHAVESGIRDAKGKNIKAIKALLDMDKITYENNELSGLTEQLQTLASAEDSSMLFGASNSPAGTDPYNPPTGGQGGTPPTAKSFAEAIAKTLNKN